MMSEEEFFKSRYIEHVVKPTDTLQGIAIQYGIKVDDIKRTNKLWTNDSIHLRKSINLPIELCSRAERPSNTTTTTTTTTSNSDSTPTSTSKSTSYQIDGLMRHHSPLIDDQGGSSSTYYYPEVEEHPLSSSSSYTNSIEDPTKQKKRIPIDSSTQSLQEYLSNVDKEVEAIKTNLGIEHMEDRKGKQKENGRSSFQNEKRSTESSGSEFNPLETRIDLRQHELSSNTNSGSNLSDWMPSFDGLGKMVGNMTKSKNENVRKTMEEVEDEMFSL